MHKTKYRFSYKFEAVNNIKLVYRAYSSILDSMEKLCHDQIFPQQEIEKYGISYKSYIKLAIYLYTCTQNTILNMFENIYLAANLVN